MFIEGHTDDIPMKAAAFAKIASNWELSAARAITVYNTLLGVQPSLGAIRNDDTSGRSGQSLIGVSGYGEHRPAVANADEASRALNRRIDLRFLMATPSRDRLGRIEGEIKERLDRAAP